MLEWVFEENLTVGAVLPQLGLVQNSQKTMECNH